MLDSTRELADDEKRALEQEAGAEYAAAKYEYARTLRLSTEQKPYDIDNLPAFFTCGVRIDRFNKY